MSLDLQLFVEQAGWLAPHLQDSSRIGVMTWMGRRLEPAARRRFAQHFPLSHGAQKAGEEGLRALLSRALVVHASRLRRVDEVVRTIDWPETYARTTTAARPPRPLLARERVAVPDRSSLGALVSLGRTWASLLEIAEENDVAGSDYRIRRLALRRAIAPQLVRGLAPCTFGHRHATRLRRLDDDAAASVRSIEDALGFWTKMFGGASDADVRALERVGQLLDAADAKNIDTLMEATVALSVARAALGAERADWPTLFPWSILSVDDPKAMYPVVRLRSGDLICEISKGTPLSGESGSGRTKIADVLSPWADEALPPTGRARSSGRQPDLVVSFWFEADPSRVVFALGDAKRNASGDGEGYIRTALEVAATYLMSFGYRMGHTLPSAEGGAHRTALMPGITLFCRQGTGRDAKSAVEMLRADRAPVLMAFDLEKHLEPGARPWHSPVLAAWLGSLGRQAVAVLGGIAPRRRRRRG